MPHLKAGGGGGVIIYNGSDPKSINKNKLILLCKRNYVE